MFTAEMREKAAATRAAKKLKRQQEPENGNGHSGTIMVNIEAPDYDWEEAPLHEAQIKAADMLREYQRVAAIIVKRQNPANAAWTCWTELERKNPEYEFPKIVLKNCQRRGPDGTWKFRDDGRFIVLNGVRTLQSAFCCNSFCYQIYQKYRVRPAARA